MLEKKSRRIGGKPTLLQNFSQNWTHSVLTFQQEESEMQTALKHKKAMFPDSVLVCSSMFISSLRLQEMTDLSSEVAFFPRRVCMNVFLFSGTLWWTCRGNPCQRHHGSRFFHKNTHQVHNAVSTSINAVPEVLQEFRVVAANTQCKEGLTVNSLLPMPVLAYASSSSKRHTAVSCHIWDHDAVQDGC